MYNIFQSIEQDPSFTRVVQMPSFRLLRERVWTEPLVFLYEGEVWPSSVHPWSLCEVNRTLFSVPISSPQSVEEQPCCPNSHALHASRHELVGTVFVFERYQLFARGVRQQQQPHPFDIDAAYNQPVSSVLVRICINDSHASTEEKGMFPCIMHQTEAPLRRMMFCTLSPLLSSSLEQLERTWGNCVKRRSQSDAESGGLSSHTDSSRSAHEEIPPTSPLRPERARFLFPAALSEPEAAPGDPPTCPDLAGAPLRCATVLRLFEQEAHYRIDVAAAWARWTADWDAIGRAAVVNSVDDIVTSLDGSRAAAHVAVSYLDAFLHAAPRVVREAAYFSGVLLACAMLACKQVDRAFPPIRAFLRCARPESRLTAEDFVRYEMEVLRVLSFRLHPLTALEVVEALLELCAEGGAGAHRGADLCKLARFFADLALRSTRAQTVWPTALGLAVVAVAAEKTDAPLPAPIAALLPAATVAAGRADGRLECFTQRTRAREAHSAEGGVAAAMAVVREICHDCMQRPIDGVLRRRYDMNHRH